MTFFGATHHAGHSDMSNMPGMKTTKTFKYEVATSDLHNLTIKENGISESEFEVIKLDLYSL